MTKLTEKDVKWIVNDLGELGVEIHGQQFFCYKGESLNYGDPEHSENHVNGVVLHDDETPRLYRRIGKREFGETVWPQSWLLRGYRDTLYRAEINSAPANFSCDPLQQVGNTTAEDNRWKPLPAETK